MHAKAAYAKCVLQEHMRRKNKFSDDVMEYNTVE